jgi:hypothetical protein
VQGSGEDEKVAPRDAFDLRLHRVS